MNKEDDNMDIFDNLIKVYKKNNIGLNTMSLGFFSLYLKKLLNSQEKNIIVVQRKYILYNHEKREEENEYIFYDMQSK